MMVSSISIHFNWPIVDAKIRGASGLCTWPIDMLGKIFKSIRKLTIQLGNYIFHAQEQVLSCDIS